VSELRYNGEPRFFDGPSHAGGRAGIVVPQQAPARRLLAGYEAGGGDIRFEGRDVALHDPTADHPRVTSNEGEIAARVRGRVRRLSNG
jgi:p-hydroxybenzoate 3-monooxygenase